MLARDRTPYEPLKLSRAIWFAVAAVAAFHLAYASPWFSWCIVFFLYCLFRLADLATLRVAFWFGLAIGLAAYSPHLAFFWTLFGPSAIALWCVLSFWLAMFLMVGKACLMRFGPFAWAFAAAFVWTGLEYFRSELYYLRFTWLSPGYAFSGSLGFPLAAKLGVYGAGFVLMALVSYVATFVKLSKAKRLGCGFVLFAILIVPSLLPVPKLRPGKSVDVTGVQLEGSPPSQVKSALDAAIRKYPKTDVFVLSEYAFMSPIPPEITQWCKQHKTWLVAGGKDPQSQTQYYNTVFVIGPDGATAFQQAKCVPVQFMIDGMPARDQRVWASPWGKLGFGLCYDASYTRVTDELIRQGAQALIFPTMDNEDWGKAEHELHGRIAPMRAAEYATPVFRVCSSGISEFVQADGKVAASAPFPGLGDMLNATLELPAKGRLPLDRPLAQFSTVSTGALILFLILEKLLGPKTSK